MRRFSILLVVLVLQAMPLCAAAQQPAAALDQVLDRIVAQEQAQVKLFRGHSPLVETYIQLLAPDKALGTVPSGDKYFLGRAQLSNGVELVSLASGEGRGGKKGFLGGLFSSSMEFLPEGFLQMIYLDADSFDRQHYQFDYVRREFLGEVRCLVFDVTPVSKTEPGRFAGRILPPRARITIRSRSNPRCDS